VAHLSNLTDEEAVEFGTVVEALIGLGIEGEEGLELGAEAGAQATATASRCSPMRRRGTCWSRSRTAAPPR